MAEKELITRRLWDGTSVCPHSVCPPQGVDWVSVPRRVIKAADRVSVPRKAGQGSGGVFHAREGRIFCASASEVGSFSASRRKRKGLEPRGLMLRQTVSNHRCLSPKGFRCRVLPDYGAENLGFPHVECFHIAKCKYHLLQEHGVDKGWRRSLAPNADVPDWKCNYGTGDKTLKSTEAWYHGSSHNATTVRTIIAVK